jgi:hypothetical protein
MKKKKRKKKKKKKKEMIINNKVDNSVASTPVTSSLPPMPSQPTPIVKSNTSSNTLDELDMLFK